MKIDDETKIRSFFQTGVAPQTEATLLLEPSLRKRVAQFLVLDAQFG
jgi:hypothetical protein